MRPLKIMLALPVAYKKAFIAFCQLQSDENANDLENNLYSWELLTTSTDKSCFAVELTFAKKSDAIDFQFHWTAELLKIPVVTNLIKK